MKRGHAWHLLSGEKFRPIALWRRQWRRGGLCERRKLRPLRCQW